ncbi:MAG: M23 family metallopeptidase [bacterium]|nr:M23 family metallopeptidase [bacterium]
MKSLISYMQFLKEYSFSRAISMGRRFEQVKDVIVALLVVKRGKYSNSFINTSFFLLMITILVAGPIIAENNLYDEAAPDEEAYFQSSSIAFDPFENAVTTIISAKPRDRIIQHTVADGETLASLASRYDISVDTIKWENNLSSDLIKPGEILDIPPVTGIVYTVAAGDNIYAIAKKYNIDAQGIVNFPFNDFVDQDTFQLNPGQTLYLPDGTISPKPTTQTGQQYFAQAQAGLQGTSSFIWPASGTITSYPSWWHMALDIANSSAPAIIASDTGTVTYAGCLGWGYGCHIIVDHGNGYQSLYAHLSSIDVAAGQAVSKGQRIGLMGSTGQSTGTHLHFEIRSGGTLVSPLGFLQ